MQLRTVANPPEEHVAPESRRRVLAWVGAAVGLVVAFNAAMVIALERAPRNRGYEVVEHKWNLAANATEPVDWLFVGDSSCNQGVIPERVSAIAGGTALNLCTIGSATAADDAWIVDYYLERVGRPRAIVVVHTWDTWPRDESLLRDMLWTIPAGASAWEGRAPAITLTPRQELVARVGRWIPIYTQSSSIVALLRAPLSAPEIAFASGGFMPMETGSPAAAESDLRKHRRLVGAGDWHASEWSLGALDALIAVARDDDVPVLLAMAPVHAELAGEPDFQRWMAAYGAMLHSREAADVHVIADRPLPIPPAQIEKVDHVTVEGAAVYTDWLATRIADWSRGR